MHFEIVGACIQKRTANPNSSITFKILKNLSITALFSYRVIMSSQKNGSLLVNRFLSITRIIPFYLYTILKYE